MLTSTSAMPKDTLSKQNALADLITLLNQDKFEKKSFDNKQAFVRGLARRHGTTAEALYSFALTNTILDPQIREKIQALSNSNALVAIPAPTPAKAASSSQSATVPDDVIHHQPKHYDPIYATLFFMSASYVLGLYYPNIFSAVLFNRILSSTITPAVLQTEPNPNESIEERKISEAENRTKKELLAKLISLASYSAYFISGQSPLDFFKSQIAQLEKNYDGDGLIAPILTLIYLLSEPHLVRGSKKIGASISSACEASKPYLISGANTVRKGFFSAIEATVGDADVDIHDVFYGSRLD